MGACCTNGIGVLPPDTVAGQHKPIELDRDQRRVRFGDPCTHKSLPALCAWTYRAEDIPVMCAMGPAQPVAYHQPATEWVSEQCETIPVVLETTPKGVGLKPAPPALP